MPLTTKPKPKTYHRKRQAQHHRQSKHYLKAYWPYLPMLMVVGLGIVINGLWAQTSKNVLGNQIDMSRASLLDYTNQARQADSEQPLHFSSQLNNAAQAKAEDMVKQDYWAHNSPSGTTPWTFINGSGYQFQRAGENLAFGFNSAQSAVTAWMNSPEHRDNILTAVYQDVGFGVAESPNYVGHGPKIIVVAEYGEPLLGVATPNSQPGQAPTLVESAARPVSRLQILAGRQANLAVLIVTALAGAAMASFIFRHGLYFRRLILEGESFIVHHPLLDICLVIICTGSVILTRTAGLIA